MFAATSAELKQYEEQGFFFRERVFSAEELEPLRKASENVHRQILEAAGRGLVGSIRKFQVETLRAEGMREVRPGMIVNVLLDAVPVPLVASNLLA